MTVYYSRTCTHQRFFFSLYHGLVLLWSRFSFLTSYWPVSSLDHCGYAYLFLVSFCISRALHHIIPRHFARMQVSCKYGLGCTPLWSNEYGLCAEQKNLSAYKLVKSLWPSLKIKQIFCLLTFLFGQLFISFGYWNMNLVTVALRFP